MWTKEEEMKMALAAQLSNAQIDQMYNRKPGGLKPAVKLLVDKGWEVEEAKSAVNRIEDVYLQTGSTLEYAELSALGFITQMMDPTRETVEEMKKIELLLLDLPEVETQTAPRNRRERRRMERKSKSNGKKY